MLVQALALEASYMLQHQYHTKAAAVPVDNWAQDESTVGQRALSLSTLPGVWAVVPASGHQSSGTGAAVSAVKGDSQGQPYPCARCNRGPPKTHGHTDSSLTRLFWSPARRGGHFPGHHPGRRPGRGSGVDGAAGRGA